MNTLFVARWFPFPPTNGSELRINALLKGLAANHEVTLISFQRQPVSEKDLPENLTTLASDGALRSKLSTQGRDKVLSEFTFTQTVERLELFLEGIVDGSSEWQSASRFALSEQPTDTT